MPLGFLQPSPLLSQFPAQLPQQQGVQGSDIPQQQGQQNQQQSTDQSLQELLSYFKKKSAEKEYDAQKNREKASQITKAIMEVQPRARPAMPVPPQPQPFDLWQKAKQNPNTKPIALGVMAGLIPLALFLGKGAGGLAGAAAMHAIGSMLNAYHEANIDQFNRSYQMYRDQVEEMRKQYKDKLDQYNAILNDISLSTDAQLSKLKTLAKIYGDAATESDAQAGKYLKIINDVTTNMRRLKQIDASIDLMNKKFDLMRQELKLAEDKLKELIRHNKETEDIRKKQLPFGLGTNQDPANLFPQLGDPLGIRNE